MYSFKIKNRSNLFKYFIYSFTVLMTTHITCKKDLTLDFAKQLTGELSSSFLEYIRDTFTINTFIETGTCIGGTSANAAQVFDQVETVELSDSFYEIAKGNLSTFNNLTMYLGDSATLLPAMIKNAQGNIAFWLDGHYSANGSALGEINTPILGELIKIKESGLTNAVILIDDIRLFDKYISKIESLDIGGYPTITEICSLLLAINPNYDIIICGDILIAYEKNEEIIISAILKACTTTRVSMNLSSEQLNEIATVIGSAKDTELKTIISLYDVYCQQDHFSNYGIGAHYALWYICYLMHKKNFNLALDILEGSINLGMNPLYIQAIRNQIHTLSKTQ